MKKTTLLTAAFCALVTSGVSYAGVSEVFDIYDKDKSGYISAGELKTALQELYPDFEVTDTIVQANLAHLDSDADKKVSKDEFGTIAQYWVTDVLPLREVFAQYDKDGSDSIASAELEAALKAFSALRLENSREVVEGKVQLYYGGPYVRRGGMQDTGGITDEAIATAVSSYDKDGDGKISYAEFSGLARKILQEQSLLGTTHNG